MTTEDLEISAAEMLREISRDERRGWLVHANDNFNDYLADNLDQVRAFTESTVDDMLYTMLSRWLITRQGEAYLEDYKNYREERIYHGTHS